MVRIAPRAVETFRVMVIFTPRDVKSPPTSHLNLFLPARPRPSTRPHQRVGSVIHRCGHMHHYSQAPRLPPSRPARMKVPIFPF